MNGSGATEHEAAASAPASGAREPEPAHAPQATPRRWTLRHKLAALAAATALSWLGAELMARWVLASEQQRQQGAHALFSRDLNAFTPVDSEACAWGDTLVAHPYLEYVHHTRPPCGLDTTNNAGMTSPYALPLERAPEFFTILLEGGSVAQQLGSGPWLEQAFEERYALAPGQRFRLMNAAMGATTYPRPSISTTVYGHAVDAVIVVDGFNEVSVGDPARGVLLGAPNNLYLLHVNMSGSSRLTARVEMSRMMGEQLGSLPLLSHSFLWYFLVQAARHGVVSESTGTVHSEELSKGTYLESYRAPSSWSIEQRYQWHSQRYLEGVRVNRAIATSLGDRFAHFLQPVPNRFKPLTLQEQAHLWLDFPIDYYVSLESALAELNRAGLPTFSLLRIFEGVSAELYSDMVHLHLDGALSPGYERMAQAIAERVGPAWGLTRR